MPNNTATQDTTSAKSAPTKREKKPKMEPKYLVQHEQMNRATRRRITRQFNAMRRQQARQSGQVPQPEANESAPRKTRRQRRFAKKQQQQQQNQQKEQSDA